jgi:hypothetical protein
VSDKNKWRVVIIEYATDKVEKTIEANLLIVATLAGFAARALHTGPLVGGAFGFALGVLGGITGYPLRLFW